MNDSQFLDIDGVTADTTYLTTFLANELIELTIFTSFF